MQKSVSSEKLTELKDWFINYVSIFQHNDHDIQHNIDLKEGHTLRVCREIVYIGKQLGLNDDQLRLAEIIALLHDIGRFEQYVRYRTFNDRKSVNHARLGIEILENSGILESFESSLKEIIIKAIKYHNRHLLPFEETETNLFWAKLIRDADKLDIWKLIIDHYYRRNSEHNGAVQFNLPDTPGFSQEVYHDLINKRVVHTKHLKNLNDFKLFQVAWIFDVNFQPTLDAIKNRGYLEMIRDVLPESKEIDRIFYIIHVSCYNLRQIKSCTWAG